MTSATTLHLGLLECCSAATIPRTQLTTSISKPSCPLLSTKQIQSFTPLKSKNSRFTIVPLVAQTSDLAEQKEGDGESAIGYAGDEGVVASSWESSEELVESDGGEESLVQPSEEAKLFVGNLPYDVDSVKLAQLFDPAGIVEVCEVIYNRQTNQSRGFGFVTMSTVEEAEKAVEMFKGYEINGRPLTVNKAAPKGSQVERIPRTYEPSFRMYVGNLPWQLDNARLVEVFSEHGKVVDARVVYDRESGRSRGFGFVTMATETELNDAIAALDGQNLDGRAIRVNVAEEKPKLSFL